MKLLGTFARRAPNRVFLSIVLGALAGVSYALIIPLVLSAIDPGKDRFAKVDPDIAVFFVWQVSNYRYAVLFVLVCLLILVARTASQVILTRISMDVTTDLRTRMYRRISSAPIADLERVGMPRLIASITADVPVIIAGARLLPELLTNGVTLVGMLGFLLYLNAGVFWFVLGCIGFGVVTYQVPMMIGRRYLVRARRNLDDLHEAIRGLVHGAKELKLNRDKRVDYFDWVLAHNETRVRETAKTGHSIMGVAVNYGGLIVFFVIGAVSFVFVNHHAIDSQELSGVIMALLYVTGPVGALLNFIPQFTTAQIALKRFNELFDRIPEESIDHAAPKRSGWSTLRLEGVTYHYPNRADDSGFAVGPLDLEIRRGEITFIVGGNGSGKSTLSKLVTLHYLPDGGSIYFDGERVDQDNISGFRCGIAAIYSDYFLFDRPLGVDPAQARPQVEEYLREFALDHKVRFEHGRFSTLALSDGQKRRLALVVAMIEDAEMYLFDEWAADQDPAFKGVFYNRILPDLKARGKAVVAISHDDRYFHLADQMIVMRDGVAVRDDALAPTVAPESLLAAP
ncbi:cyclic peptide export ABC transporter [Xanthomonas sp. SS]|uniref:cyclic peptide export ABC transporter n=1 Tax=Xanthomonas sp. SS TaxID=2724122 RepID=UPI001639F3C7|nr:cyclic peptide export ABC transporter [Xanthomonas sp. SS]QNH16235.1 cyclic peptide export ABC transporter [Xanthomonas sp. SS]